MTTNESNEDLDKLLEELKEQENQKKLNNQIVSKSQVKWFEKTAKALSKVDEGFDPLQEFIAKTLGIE